MDIYTLLHKKEITTMIRIYSIAQASPVVLVVNNPPGSARDMRDASLIPGLGRSPRGRNGNLLQYSHRENSMDIGGWRVTANGVAKSWTRLSV